MKYNGKSVAGVWIDHQHAYIISTPDRKNEGTYDVIEKIGAHHHNDHGSSEKVHNNKETQTLHQLYKDVAKHVESMDALLIIGPGKAQEEFKNFLHENKHFHSKEIALDSANHLSMNEMIAKVRMHFYHN